MRKLAFALALLGAASPLVAQDKDPDVKAAGGGALPAGWQMRLDRKTAKAEDAKFVTMGPGFHVTSGPSAVYYNPSQMAKGNYTVTASFTQTKKPTHPEAYGIIFAGKQLDTPTQQYMYFIVRGDGKYMIKHRADDATVHTITEWTENAAVTKEDASGKATNELSAVLGASKVSFLVNGTEVHSIDRSVIAGPGHIDGLDGVVGLRVNHNLDVHVGSFAVRQQ